MHLSDFDFSLPPELIAQNPVTPRDQARFLVYNRSNGTIEHAQVKDIGQFLPNTSIVVGNNSRVRQGRLFGRTTKPVEVLVLEKTEGTTYRCLLKGHHQIGQVISFYSGPDLQKTIPLTATILAAEPDPSMTTYLLHFESEESCETLFEHYGTTPLPPYIKNSSAPAERYQTTFAKDTGSAAAPTAGLHFTPELIQSLKEQGISWEEVTLHVGIGTFLPLRHEEITSNRLHSEATYISPETAARLSQAKQDHIPITAIGTTSTRTLESHSQNQDITAGWQDTSIFIYPGYVFQSVSHLLTNFHLPKSSLLLLVAAFLGNRPQTNTLADSESEMVKTLQYIYRTAIEQQYRFYSFGDALLIL